MEKRGRKIGGGQENAARMTRCFENSSHFAAREGREGMTPPCTVRSQNGTNVSKLRISTLYKYTVLRVIPKLVEYPRKLHMRHCY